MILTMAYEVTGSRELTLVLESEVAVTARGNDRRIEVDKMRIVRRIPLITANAMRVMTDIARGIFATNMLVVFLEAFVIQNTVSAVAAITQSIIRRTFRCVVSRHILSRENRLEYRAVRAFRTGPADAPGSVRVMAIDTTDDRLLGQWVDQAGDVIVLSHRANRVKRGVSGLDLQPHVGLVVLPGRTCWRLIRAVPVTAQAYFIGRVGLGNCAAANTYPPDVGRRIARASPHSSGMWIVAIGTLDVSRIDDCRLGRIVNGSSVFYAMR